MPEEVFVVRQARLNDSYIGQRLQLYYAERTGCRITAHQLRHSCATMLLNAGMSLEGVQYVLGHKRIDTTLGYARLYSHTISTEYANAMARIEERLNARQGKAKAPVTVTDLLVLAQSINGQPLAKRDQTTLKLLCQGLSELAIQLEGS